MMRPFAQCLPFPARAVSEAHTTWPVWHGSTTTKVTFQPLPKKAAVKLWHRARDFDRQTRRKGHHGGVVGPTALQVLQVLLFDFLHFATGQLDPSYAAIARKANLCERAVADALARLKTLGMLNWLRRAKPSCEGGAFALVQDTNAYAVLPATQWHGYRPPPECPPPAPGTWGDHPCGLRAPLTEAVAEQRHGGGTEAVVRQLDLSAPSSLESVLARLGKAVLARDAAKA